MTTQCQRDKCNAGAKEHPCHHVRYEMHAQHYSRHRDQACPHIDHCAGGWEKHADQARNHKGGSGVTGGKAELIGRLQQGRKRLNHLKGAATLKGALEHPIQGEL